MRKRILMVAAAITVMLSTFTGCANKEMVLTADNITISGKLEKEAKYVSLKDTDKEETESGHCYYNNCRAMYPGIMFFAYKTSDTFPGISEAPYSFSGAEFFHS